MGTRDLLIRRLQDSMEQTVTKIQNIPEEFLGQPCRHGCARGKSVWHLLTHNIEHERMHTGQIIGTRDIMDRLQQTPKTKLLAELYIARSTFIASLFDLTDEEIDFIPEGQEWSIRQIIDHVLFWDRDSIDDMQAQYQEERSDIRQ